MTDRALEPSIATPAVPDARRKRIAKRYAAERRFKALGMGAVLAAVGFLVLLLSTVVGQGLPAFTYHKIIVPLNLTEVSAVEPEKASYRSIVNDAIDAALPFTDGRTERRAARGLVSGGNEFMLPGWVADGELVPGQVENVALLADDFADLYLKGLVASRSARFDAVDADGGAVTLTDVTGDVEIALPSERAAQEIAEHLERVIPGSDPLTGPITLSSRQPSVLLYLNGGTVKLKGVDGRSAEGEVLVPPSARAGENWSVRVIRQAEANRKIDDRAIAYLDYLEEQGRIENGFNTQFFTGGASREPELAGIWGAVVGSFLTLVVTLAVSFPIGVAAAIYLEEFAPKNRITSFIEVNINNLAAVPSIVFGLLGLAVFLNWFGMPRSAPLVGGLVLALMTLPTIIIASRAAIRAVPPSIREAALGVGASKVQSVFHHVLPLAMPGILTGSIIGMAQALGETAPLLMIGMVAFIVDIPNGFTDAATVLPVQIFMWADFPEAGFRQKTSAAIMVLLAFLVLMNALAVFLRRRFERRW